MTQHVYNTRHKEDNKDAGCRNCTSMGGGESDLSPSRCNST